MTWAGGHCLYCQKRIPLRQKDVEFCSPDCASAHSREATDKRHGIAPSPATSDVVRPAARSFAVTQRIRQQVDANAARRRTQSPPAQPPAPEPPVADGLALPKALLVDLAPLVINTKPEGERSNSNTIIKVPDLENDENPSLTPSLITDLKRLNPPAQRAAPIAPRGSFPFFPIGDLALVAPVQLPTGVGAVAQASPSFVQNTRSLSRPIPKSAACPPHLGISTPEYEGVGSPQFSGLLISIGVSGFQGSSQIPLRRSNFLELPTLIARQSEVDELLPISSPAFPPARDQAVPNLQVALGQLKCDFLSNPVRVPRSGGAQMVTLAPLRPTAFLLASPEVPPSSLALPEPDWCRGIPIPIPGLRPRPQNHRQPIKEIAPWFVPSRPKPPMLSLDVLPAPEGWKPLRQGFVANPVPPAIQQSKFQPPVESTKADLDLSAIATALEDPLVLGIDRRRPADSPWPRRRRIPVITPITDWWMTCSNQVKVMVIALPLLCAIAIKPLTHVGAGAPSMEERPSAPVRAAHTTNPPQTLPGVIPSVPADFEANLQKVTKSKFDSFKHAVASRAAVEMADDFQSGLDSWEGNGQLGPSWSYDRTGFIRPRALGIYSPSMPLADYAFEFLGKIDQRAISWVFRASDLNNYYVMKLVDKTGGSTPQMVLVHYAVIEGREGPKKEVPLPITVYKDTLFRIRMDIQGPHFSVQVQGSVVDYWKDTRLKSGGVGFFTGRGEESRVRWVQVTHQDDYLGKLCAFLAPYAM